MCPYIYTHMYIYTYTHIHIYTHTCIHTYTFISVYVCLQFSMTWSWLTRLDWLPVSPQDLPVSSQYCTFRYVPSCPAFYVRLEVLRLGLDLHAISQAPLAIHLLAYCLPIDLSLPMSIFSLCYFSPICLQLSFDTDLGAESIHWVPIPSLGIYAV